MDIYEEGDYIIINNYYRYNPYNQRWGTIKNNILYAPCGHLKFYNNYYKK